MATVVYQGFQSHFESQHFEPRTLRLRLSSPNNPHLTTVPLKSHFIDSPITPPDTTTTVNAASLSSSDPNAGSNSGSWSILESLSNSSSDNDKEKKTLLPYIQPPSSRRTLSDESLALCTESLGSETGSDVIDDLEFLSGSSELQTMETRMSTTPRSSREDRKRNAIASLPPPLTSMRGFNSIQVKSHREDGRLVMTATTPPPRNRCLQDRSNGCVRLAILIDSDDHIETETKKEEEETIEIERDNEEENQEYEEEDEEKQEIEVMAVERSQISSRRCVQGDRENRGFLNWESLCVATS
ncbi:unnamed protein product [Microthlaspi erraticum]|uniref:FAF domain-containing protein n=1 Tax=Microthlaspi erraticum TaxID=1685480 RepID=A0A6D2HIJ2_9BRAS|nr:unnamed protein product [Microthlaspi erraticum]